MKQRITKGKKNSKCAKCKTELEEKRVGKQRYCLACHAEYMRLHRPKHSDLSDEKRQKANARSYLNVYIKRGKVAKKPCQVCGKLEGLEAHHEDYNKPLEVQWFCREHHLKKHEQ